MAGPLYVNLGRRYTIEEVYLELEQQSRHCTCELCVPTRKKETNTMDNSKVLLLMQPQDVIAVRVSYDEKNTGQNNIKKTMDKTIAVGDYVIVETNTRHNMTVCRVEAVNIEVDFDDPTPIQWVISKVDKERFEEVKRLEAELLETIRQGQLRRKREETMESIKLALGEDGMKKLPKL